MVSGGNLGGDYQFLVYTEQYMAERIKFRKEEKKKPKDDNEKKLKKKREY